jgi:adenosylmethionine-8-amino-7-oxononanoate aminotransferase
MSKLWHGFADMHSVASSELVIRSGRGVVITDVAGREYLDATASLWYCNVGFGRTEIAERVARQLERLSAYSNFGAFATESTVALADRLAQLSPLPDTVVFLGSGGSDAVDTAAKLARRYWDLMGRPERRVIVSREHSYHGMHGWGTSLAGIPSNKAGYGGAFIDEVVQVGASDTEALGALFEQRGREIAAFIGEPVIGAGGVIPPEPHYWAEVNRLCREHDVLLIADEVITAFGRVGEWFGSTRYGIDADMITFAKGVSSGYLPIGGVLVAKRVRAPFWDEPVAGAVFRHGYTYGGHAAAAEAAMANLDIVEREDLIARVRELEPILDRTVRRLADAPLVGEIRTVGLTAAVALRSDLVAADPALADKVAAASIRHGVATRSLRGHAIQLSPAFVISEAQLEAIVDGFRRALEEVAAAR